MRPLIVLLIFVAAWTFAQKMNTRDRFAELNLKDDIDSIAFQYEVKFFSPQDSLRLKIFMIL